MRTYSLSLLILLMLAAVSAKADTFYQITGDIVLVGNNVCNGPCIEVIDFSFAIEYGPAPFGGFQTNILPGGTAESFGPLASFSGNIGPGSPKSVACCNYLGFFNSLSDEIDLPLLAFYPTPPQVFDAYLYGCGLFGKLDTTCVNDFVPPGGSPIGTFLGATDQVTVTPMSSVPETSTLIYLIVALGIGISAALGRKLRFSC